MRVPVGPLVVLVAFSSVDCGGSPTMASGGSTTTPPPAPAPSVQSVTIGGSPVLQSIGATARLTATALFNDNTTRDVTAEATWTSENTGVFGVSAGVVTVVNYGFANVRATVGNRVGSRQLVATPPDTVIVYGRAREPGMSSVPSVRVLETASNRSVLTDPAGNFQLAALASPRSFKFDKDGYENTEVIPDIVPGTLNFVESAMQRVVRVPAGSVLTSLFLAPHDVSYVIGSDSCYPCKLIRVTTASSGTLRVLVTGASASSLHIWVNGRRSNTTTTTLTTDVQVGAGETPVYVGWDLPLASGGTRDYTNFNFSTSMLGS